MTVTEYIYLIEGIQVGFFIGLIVAALFGGNKIPKRKYELSDDTRKFLEDLIKFKKDLANENPTHKRR